MKEKKEISSTNSFVAQIDLMIASQLRIDLIDQGFELSLPAHTIFSGKKKGVSCTLYQSGKLLVQGKEMKEFIEFYLEPHILKTFAFTHQSAVVDTALDTTPRIGIDESGKGDFFGPLCIAGVQANKDQIIKLKAIGVKDSKAMSDDAMRRLAPKIRESCTHHVVRINPPKYNELYAQFLNLNRLLAWGHATAIEQLVTQTQCKTVVVDQFADEHVVETALKRKKLQVNLTQRHRAEEDVVVAAASILARCAFLDGLVRLKEQFSMEFPKGASKGTVEAGRRFVRAFGKEALHQVAKVHFKTTLQLS